MWASSSWRISGPDSTKSRTGWSIKRDSTRAALSAEPWPMPAQASTLPGRLSEISMPTRTPAWACSKVMAGPVRVLRVPWAILRAISRACGAKDSAMPQSTTASCRPCRRANTETGRRFCRANWACSRVLRPHCWPMRSTTMPWSAANKASTGSRKRGVSEFCTRPRRTAKGSSSPRPPAMAACRSTRSRKAFSSSGLAVGEIRDWCRDM